MYTTTDRLVIRIYIIYAVCAVLLMQLVNSNDSNMIYYIISGCLAFDILFSEMHPWRWR